MKENTTPPVDSMSPSLIFLLKTCLDRKGNGGTIVKQ
jgi:hypothetical protein